MPPCPRLAGLIVPTMALLTLPTSIPDGRRKAVFCCWYDDEAHAPSSNVRVSSSVVVFIFAPPLKTRLVAFRDLNFVFTSTYHRKRESQSHVSGCETLRS